MKMESTDWQKFLEVKSKYDSITHTLSRALEIKSRINTIKKYYEEYLELNEELAEIILSLKGQEVI